MLAQVDGKLLPFPINLDTVNRLYGLDLDEDDVDALVRRTRRADRPRSAPRKTWWSARSAASSTRSSSAATRASNGASTRRELDKSVTARVPTRTNRDDRYFTDRSRRCRCAGYTRMFERMLDHPNITIVLDTDFRDVRDAVRDRQRLIYTGPVDAFFDYRYGTLPYRSLRFEHVTLDEPLAPAGRRGELSADRAPTRASPSSST